MVRTKKSAGKDARSDPMPSNVVVESHFRSNADKRVFLASFSKRDVLPGRVFAPETLGETNFAYLSNLSQCKWLPLTRWKSTVFIDLVQIFYFNALTEFNGRAYDNRFQTFIANSPIEVRERTLADFLDIPCNGETYSSQKFNVLEAYKFLTNNPSLDHIPDFNSLSLDLRILHLIICQCISPRKGNFARIYPEDLWYMFCIAQNKPINLPAMLISKILYAKAHPKQSLPFGCIISAFIRSKFPSIGLSSSQIISESRLPVFNSTSLLKMGYEFLPSRQTYVKSARPGAKRKALFEDEDEEEEEEGQGTAARTSVPAPSAGASSSAVTPDMLASIHAKLDRVLSGQEALGARQEAIEARQVALEAQIEALRKASHEDTVLLREDIFHLQQLVHPSGSSVPESSEATASDRPQGPSDP